jgi:Tfp pilus assembly protein PilP
MTINVLPIVAFVAIGLAAPQTAQAQAPPPATAPAGQQPAPTPSKPKVDLPAPPANFEYTVDGRRDPFVSLVNRGADARTTDGNQALKRAEGVPGLMTSEITVRGIVQTRGEFVAMVAGVDGKVFSIRVGDKLADGVVRQVTSQAVVILQEVNDPLSLDKQREVRKLLRGGDEVK